MYSNCKCKFLRYNTTMGRKTEAVEHIPAQDMKTRPLDVSRLIDYFHGIGKPYSYGLPRYSLSILLGNYDSIAQDASSLTLREVEKPAFPKHPNGEKVIVNMPGNGDSFKILKKYGVLIAPDEDKKENELSAAASLVAETGKGFEGRMNITLGLLWRTVYDFSCDPEAASNRKHYKTEFADAIGSLEKHRKKNLYSPRSLRYLLYQELLKSPGQAFDHLVNRPPHLATS